MLNKEIRELLPERLRGLVERVVLKEEKLQEIRIRREKGIALRYDGRFVVPEQKQSVTMAEWKELISRISRQSLYAFEGQMREGFLTIPGGHRVGLAGHVVYEHGAVKTMRYLSGLNIRISHEIKGCSDELMPFVVLNTVILPTLIIAPPGGGKTTLLRDFVRNLSRQCNVAVVDERSEIAGCYMGISQRDLGSFCDVLDGCKKADGVRMMIRSMAPQVVRVQFGHLAQDLVALAQVVAVDEIGTSEDIAALSYALTSGCSLLATIHGETLSQVRQKKEFQAVFENRMFERYILLDNLFHPGKCLAVYDKEGKTIWK